MVDVHISKLRQKIDADCERPLLRTVRNAGYMLTADELTRTEAHERMHAAPPRFDPGVRLRRSWGIAALVLFAAPLWYAWQVTIEDGRVELLQDDAQRLADVFQPRGRRTGSRASSTRASACRSPASACCCSPMLDVPAARRQHARVAARRAARRPATTRSRSISPASRRAASPWCDARCRAATTCWSGRDVARFAPLERRFWYGLAGAVAVLSIVGVLGGFLIRRALLTRIHGIRQTVPAIMQGDLSHRLPSPRARR